MKFHRFKLLAATLALAAGSSGCATHAPLPAYAPGLGEIMAQISVRHAKLWFAGHEANWPLAVYELDELKEGFEDAERFHPTHKKLKGSLPALIGQWMRAPIEHLENAVKARDSSGFATHFDRLTAACNGCHQVSDFGFNVVSRPAFNPFANQSFVPSRNPG